MRYDEPSAFLALGFLLILSILTVRLCGRDKSRPRLETTYLFAGKSFIHSLVSNAGAIFSVTYFFGATIIFSSIYRQWLILLILAVLTIAMILLLSILKRLEETVIRGKRNLRTSNALIEFVRLHTGKDQFHQFIAILVPIYIGLLIEELAVSRVIISQVFSSNELLSSIILIIIVTVVYAYLYIGGFKAVLNSDLIQGSVLIAFLALLVILSAGSNTQPEIVTSGKQQSVAWLVSSLIMWGLFGVTWVVGSLDFYSRLNFVVRSSVSHRARRVLIVLSVSSTLVIVMVGLYFAMSNPQVHQLQSPEQYFEVIVRHFLSTGSSIYTAIFLVTLFSMIFTTVDTLLITILQIYSFSDSRRPGISIRSRLSLILFISTIISVVIPVNMVCAGGLFIGSLLLIPLSASLQTIYPRLKSILPHDWRYMWVSLIIASGGFVFFYEEFETAFENQGYIIGLAGAAIIITTIIFQSIPKLRRTDELN